MSEDGACVDEVTVVEVVVVVVGVAEVGSGVTGGVGRGRDDAAPALCYVC